MCQYSDNKKMTKLKTDLVVYKILNNYLKSPYRSFQYELDKKYSVDRRAIRKSIVDTSTCFEFNKGFHSFIDLDQARKYARTFCNYSFYDICDICEVEIYECIIPKGSYVNYGRFGLLNHQSVVSNQIVI